MWTKDKASFRGKTFDVSEAPVLSKTCPEADSQDLGWRHQRKRLPRVFPELADVWDETETSPEEYGRKLEVLRTYCQASHRRISDMELSYYGSCITGRDEDEVETRFKKLWKIQEK